METTINNNLIRSFNPCYNPIEVGIPYDETLSVREWIEKYRSKVKNKEDILWLVCRNEFMSDRDMRLFAVWCAREALKLDNEPDQRSINSCDVSEKFANGEATQEELSAARVDAWAAASDAAWAAASVAARAAASDAASDAAWAAARAAARAAAWVAARAAASDAAWAAASDAARAAAWATASDAQVEKLLTYFE